MLMAMLHKTLKPQQKPYGVDLWPTNDISRGGGGGVAQRPSPVGVVTGVEFSRLNHFLEY